MHDPVSLTPLRRLPSIKHQRLLHPDQPVPSVGTNLSVDSGGLPVTGNRCPVRSVPSRVLCLLGAKEVSLFLPIPCHFSEFIINIVLWIRNMST